MIDNHSNLLARARDNINEVRKADTTTDETTHLLQKADTLIYLAEQLQDAEHDCIIAREGINHAQNNLNSHMTRAEVTEHVIKTIEDQVKEVLSE